MRCFFTVLVLDVFSVLRSFVEVLQVVFILGKSFRNDGQMQYKNTECYATEKNLLILQSSGSPKQSFPLF